MRVDKTVVELHYPTDSSLLGDGVHVLVRTMKKITKLAGELGTKLCDRSLSVKRRVFDITRAARSKAKRSSEKLTRAYDQLPGSTTRVVGPAKRFSVEIAAGVKTTPPTILGEVISCATRSATSIGMVIWQSSILRRKVALMTVVKGFGKSRPF